MQLQEKTKVDPLKKACEGLLKKINEKIEECQDIWQKRYIKQVLAVEVSDCIELVEEQGRVRQKF